MIRLSPYPNVYIENVLSEDECDSILKHWPEQSYLMPEGNRRNLFDFMFDDVSRIDQLQNNIQPFWTDMLSGKLNQILTNVANIFAPYIGMKFGNDVPKNVELQIHRLMCLEAEDGFEEHKPHAHAAAPNWTFTWLLYINDNDRGDRGTTLYKIDGLRKYNLIDHRGFFGKLFNIKPVKSNFGWPDVFMHTFPECKFTPESEGKFKSGSILAFLDSPISIHGSTPFDLSKKQAGRKLVRGHVSLNSNDVNRIYKKPDVPIFNAEMGQIIQKYTNENKDVECMDIFENDIEMTKQCLKKQLPKIKSPKMSFPSLNNLK